MKQNTKTITPVAPAKTITPVAPVEKITISSELEEYNKNYTNNLNVISNAKKDNKNIIKEVLNLFLLQVKQLKNQKDYTHYNKKGLLVATKTKIEKDLHSDFLKIITAVFIYLESGSELNFKEITKTAFLSGMLLINQKKYIKFKSNKDLLDALQKIKDEEELKKAKALLKL
jgi:hypothetical protein